MEDWGVNDTNEARAGAAATTPSQRRRRQRRQRQRGGEMGGGYSPDAEKGWKAGQPWKDDRMDPQGRVGQER